MELLGRAGRSEGATLSAATEANKAAARPGPRGWRFRHLSMRRREAALCYLFIAPGVLGYLVFILGPMLYSLLMSFMDYGIITPARWVGLDNWRHALFEDPLVWKAMSVTAYFSIGAVTVTMVAAFLVALLLNQRIVARKLARTIYFMPTVITGVPVALLWSWIFNPSFGVLNSMLGWIGIPGPQWLLSEFWVIPALIIMQVWSMGGTVVIYLAGLQGIPTQMYEAADLDGAGRFKKTIYITIPLLSPIILFNLVLSVIGAFQSFVQAFIMTEGGPNNSSLFMVLYIYRNAFAYFKLGYASALAWMLFAVLFVVTLLVFRSQRWWVHEEGDQ